MHAQGQPLVIDARAAGPLALGAILGVPLYLWALRTVSPRPAPEQVTICATDPGLLADARRRGFRTADRPAQGALQLSIDRPFRRAGGGGPDGGAAYIDPIRVLDAASLEFARAVARGLAPDHPCIAGVARLRLPLGRDIRAVVTDVDGCLTDGGIGYGGGPDALRTFNTHDGLGHHLLAQAGIAVAWLSATSSAASIERRAAQLRVPLVDAAPGDKGPRLREICRKLALDPSQVLYLGDDVNDLPAIEIAGCSACPADGAPTVRARVDLVLDARGGRGAFREAAEIVLAGRAVAPPVTEAT